VPVPVFVAPVVPIPVMDNDEEDGGSSGDEDDGIYPE
jgi:hypothetical protein